MEYEDEFGRIRTARRSEVPRELAPASGDEEFDDDEYVTIVIYFTHLTDDCIRDIIIRKSLSLLQ